MTVTTKPKATVRRKAPANAVVKADLDQQQADGVDDPNSMFWRMFAGSLINSKLTTPFVPSYVRVRRAQKNPKPDRNPNNPLRVPFAAQ